MPDVWIVIVEDRHVDVEYYAFSTEEAAVAWARREMQVIVARPSAMRELPFTDEDRADGLVLRAKYEFERDQVRVVRRGLNEPERDREES